MLNPQSNQPIENPFHGIDAEPFLAFFRNEEHYNAAIKLLTLVERALFVPAPPFHGETMEAEYWRMMAFLAEKNLVREYRDYRESEK